MIVSWYGPYRQILTGRLLAYEARHALLPDGSLGEWPRLTTATVQGPTGLQGWDGRRLPDTARSIPACVLTDESWAALCAEARAIP